MYSNFLKITLRNLWNYKFYALINVVGLGVGLAAIIWAFQNYRFSFSYDNFHNDPEHVFRAMIFREGNDAIHGICPSAAPVVAMQEFSGIQHALRIDSRGVTVKADASEAITQQVHFTDDGFFEVFNFPLVSGTYDLSDPAAVLITEDIAAKLYGKADPIGKTVTFYAGDSCQINLIVKGVLQQLPMNSMMWFKVITHWDNLRKFDCTPIADDDWGWFADGVFFKLNNPEDAPRLESYLNKFVTVQNNARPDWKMTSYRLENLPTFSRRTEMNANGFNERPEDSAAYGPLVLAVLIFISACLNFTNTTISRSSSRLREMGVRKVMGGTRGQLTMQLLSECAVVVLAGILLSIALNALWFPVYNRMWEALDLQVNYAKDPTLQIFLLGSLVAMEPPATFSAKAVRDEKAKVLRCLRPIPLDQMNDFVVRGQYTKGFAEGKDVPAYRSETNVSPTSTTETFSALKLYVDNWRWADVPFYIRSGKRLAKRVSEITIQFRRVPHMLFQGIGMESIEPNVMSVRIQPDEGISLKISAKVPGTVPQIRPVKMDFRYGESFGASPPTAYETLLLDCMLGDSTLFNRDDAVELSWELVDPLLNHWREQGDEGLTFYESGSWGPAQADTFIQRDGRRWHAL